MKPVTVQSAHSRKLHVLEIALLLGLAIFFVTGGVALRTQDQLAEKVVRLHILANSDSEEDQALKLQVRDVVLARATEILEQSADRQEAEARLRGQLLELEHLAAEEIRAEGYDYPVTVELTDTPFPTREYDGFTLPAGEYLALRVVIGAGEGHNWWCVVFPPLCLSAAEAQEALETLGGDSAQLLAPAEDGGVVFKFRLLELWGELMEYLGLD